MTLSRAALDFPEGLPIGQLQVEIHTDKLKPTEMYSAFQNWWNLLCLTGLRPFHQEPNSNDPEAVSEYSFLNIRHGMFKIDNFPNPQLKFKTLAHMLEVVVNAIPPNFDTSVGYQ